MRYWHNTNGVKLCDRWRDSDKPRAATIIVMSGAATVLGPPGVAVFPIAAEGVSVLPFAVAFPPHPKARG